MPRPKAAVPLNSFWISRRNENGRRGQGRLFEKISAKPARMRCYRWKGGYRQACLSIRLTVAQRRCSSTANPADEFRRLYHSRLPVSRHAYDLGPNIGVFANSAYRFVDHNLALRLVRGECRYDIFKKMNSSLSFLSVAWVQWPLIFPKNQVAPCLDPQCKPQSSVGILIVHYSFLLDLNLSF